MRDISINDLAHLVVAEVPDCDERIQKMFDWHFMRDMMITRWVLGAAATIGGGFLVAVFKAEVSPIWWQVLLLVAIPTITATYGLFRLYRVRSIHRQFVAALHIYHDLHRLRPFLLRYQQERHP